MNERNAIMTLRRMRREIEELRLPADTPSQVRQQLSLAQAKLGAAERYIKETYGRRLADEALR